VSRATHPIRAAFLPMRGSENPYQHELARALAAQWPWPEVARRTVAVYRSDRSTISAASATDGDSAIR
jgi:hypothetical protein